jgi:uncharacterized repeat protein (TIGR03803 family)
MPSRKIPIAWTVVLAMFAMTMFSAGTRAAAQTEKVLHNFSYIENGKDGNQPQGGLVSDDAGNLYGTTIYGGTGLCGDGAGGVVGCGIVFELIPQTGGGWKEQVIHNFIFNGKDGQAPNAGLIFDAAGNLYGTTADGGTGPCSISGAYSGCGTVFELTPRSGGWSETTLHNFDFNGLGKDGQTPLGRLVFDASGNLYGTTQEGGVYGLGTVFELMPKSGGWAETILHNFGNGKDGGSQPVYGLIFDTAGNLYGTAAGGANGEGMVFELTPKSGGWAETVLHSFNNDGADATDPEGSLVFDAAGNLYGTTFSGGSVGGGTVFQLTPVGGGIWTETILHNFGNGGDGANPGAAGLIFDASGNLYGTTLEGGTYDYGTVFELLPAGAGLWIETILHSFNRNVRDGIRPVAGLIFETSGNLYGITQGGGVYGNGTVFEVTP